METDIAIWLTGAVLVVGLTEYIKDMLKFISPKHKWIYAVISAILSVVVGIHSGGARLVWDTLGILTCSQLGYELIIQKLRHKLKGE